MRSVTRDRGLWKPGPGAGSPHFGRMVRAAEQCVSFGVAPERLVTYVEDPSKHRALLVDTLIYQSARDEREKQGALLYAGQVPQPAGEEIEASAQALHYGGLRSPRHLYDVYLAAVVEPRPSTEEELQFYEVALRRFHRDLSPEQAAVYRGKLRLAGRLS